MNEAERVRAALDARPPYQLPKFIHDSAGRRERVPARLPLLESYLDQVIALPGKPHRLAVHKVEARTDLQVSDVPCRVLLTGWNPVGQPRTLEENEAANRAVTELLSTSGGHLVRKLTVTSSLRTWLEDWLEVGGLSSRAVTRLARDAGQPFVYLTAGAKLVLLPTGLLPSEGPGAVVRLQVETTSIGRCPMRTDDSTERCAMHGGPWTSGSIHAAAIWKAHRSLLVSRLGCRPCDGQRLPTLGPLGRVGGPLVRPNSELVIGSRYGGYAWR